MLKPVKEHTPRCEIELIASPPMGSPGRLCLKLEIACQHIKEGICPAFSGLSGQGPQIVTTPHLKT